MNLQKSIIFLSKMASCSQEKMWREAEYKLLSERRQAEKAMPCATPVTRF